MWVQISPKQWERVGSALRQAWYLRASIPGQRRAAEQNKSTYEMFLTAPIEGRKPRKGKK